MRRLLYVVGFSLAEPAGRTIGTLNKHQELTSLLERVDLWDLSHTIGGRIFGHRRRALRVLGKALALAELNVRVFVGAFLLKRWDTVLARDVPLFGARLLRLRNVPFVVEVHADFGEEARMLGGRIQRMVAPFYARVLDRQLRGADAVIFNHPLLERSIRARLGLTNQTLAVYNGADVRAFDVMDKRTCRAALGLPLDRPIVMFVGHVKVWHGVELLLQTFGALRLLAPGIELYIVGGGGSVYARALQEQFANAEGVHFLSAVSRSVSRQYMCAADLCALPVNNIRASPGSPIKLYDYAACGKPIVTQAGVEGYDDVVRKFELGIAVDFADPRPAAREIARYLQDLQQSEAATSARIRATAERDLSWRAVALRWVTFMRGLHPAHHEVIR